MTNITITKRVLTVAAISSAMLAATTGIASAGSDNGGCAAQMVNEHTWPGGMQIAMSADNPNGNGVPGGTTGMWGAISHSC